MHYLGDTYTKRDSLFIWNSHLTGHPVFYLATLSPGEGRWAWVGQRRMGWRLRRRWISQDTPFVLYASYLTL